MRGLQCQQTTAYASRGANTSEANKMNISVRKIIFDFNIT